jgi:hypothetical protein
MLTSQEIQSRIYRTLESVHYEVSDNNYLKLKVRSLIYLCDGYMSIQFANELISLIMGNETFEEEDIVIDNTMEDFIQNVAFYIFDEDDGGRTLNYLIDSINCMDISPDAKLSLEWLIVFIFELSLEYATSENDDDTDSENEYNITDETNDSLPSYQDSINDILPLPLYQDSINDILLLSGPPIYLEFSLNNVILI